MNDQSDWMVLLLQFSAGRGSQTLNAVVLLHFCLPGMWTITNTKPIAFFFVATKIFPKQE